MSPRQIDRFFRILAQEVGEPARVILTGAAAGSLWGYVRPSLDIDFAIQTVRRRPTRWTSVEQAIERTVRRTGIRVNYAEDIDRWSPISLLDYQRHTRLYRRLGVLQVRLMDPAYWSIGKISRYLDPDVRDLIKVLRTQRVSATRLVNLWGRALRRSPRSLAMTQFHRQAEHFLSTHGRAIWGKHFEADQAIARFHRACRSAV